MDKKVLLCADVESVKRPELMGLSGENLISQSWLEICHGAEAARTVLGQQQEMNEVWVLSCDSMLPINLAAALKKDKPQIPVILVSIQSTGSLKSRAKAADIDAVISQTDFLHRYQKHKTQWVPSSQNARQNERPVIEKNVHATQKKAMIIPVLSASGGTGKSTIAMLSACLSQAYGMNTLLLDADLQFGDMQFLLGAQEAVRVDELIDTPSKIDKVCPSHSLPALLAAPAQLEHSESVITHMPAILDQCSNRFDVIVVNTGSFWTEQHVMLLERAATALFILDQRPSSIRECRRVIDYCMRCALATQPFRFVLNRCTRNGLFSSLDVSCALEGCSVFELQEGGKDVGECLGIGQPQDLINSDNPLCESIKTMLQCILPIRNSQKEISHKVKDIPLNKRSWFKKERGIACL